MPLNFFQDIKSIRAMTTTRIGGISKGPFDSLNLSLRVGDSNSAVAENRRRLQKHLPSPPCWLRQIHSGKVVLAEDIQPDKTQADAAITFRQGMVCSILTADCLPVFFCDARGGGVGIAHAGWRGIASGILENTIAAMHRGKSNLQLLACIGPSIGAENYEVGEDVRLALTKTKDDDAAFIKKEGAGGGDKKYLADLTMLTRNRLLAAGVESVDISGRCTFADSAQFFSARRDGIQCGRMASIIWLAN